MNNRENNNNSFYTVYKRFTNSFEQYNKLDSNAKTFVVDKMSEIEEKTKSSRQYCGVSE